MAEQEYVNKESLARHIENSFGEISTPFVVREIRQFPAADIVPKSEVEELQIELQAMRMSANSYKMHCENARAEVAREIFEEIEKFIYRYLNDADYTGGDIIYDIAELKNKYTGERHEKE